MVMRSGERKEEDCNQCRGGGIIIVKKEADRQ